jgi:hypothetical protein
MHKSARSSAAALRLNECSLSCTQTDGHVIRKKTCSVCLQMPNQWALHIWHMVSDSHRPMPAHNVIDERNGYVCTCSLFRTVVALNFVLIWCSAGRLCIVELVRLFPTAISHLRRFHHFDCVMFGCNSPTLIQSIPEARYTGLSCHYWYALCLSVSSGSYLCGLRLRASGKHVGTGVLLALAFIHLLPPAINSLSSPCLPAIFSKYSFAPLVAMVSALLMQMLENTIVEFATSHLAAAAVKAAATPTVLNHQHKDGTNHPELVITVQPQATVDSAEGMIFVVRLLIH